MIFTKKSSRNLILFASMIVFLQACSQQTSNSTQSPSPQENFPKPDANLPMPDSNQPQGIFLEIPAATSTEYNNLVQLAHSKCEETSCVAQAKLLLSSGSSLEEKDPQNGNATPLLISIGMRHFKLAQFLILSKANVNVDAEDHTPLTTALVQLPKSEETLKLLVKEGAVLDYFNDRSILVDALRYSASDEIIKYLLSVGASPLRTGTLIVEKDNSGYPRYLFSDITPLAVAAAYGKVDLFNFLLPISNTRPSVSFHHWTGGNEFKELSLLDIVYIGRYRSGRSEKKDYDAIVAKILDLKIALFDEKTLFFAAESTRTPEEIDWFSSVLAQNPNYSIDYQPISGGDTIVRNIAFKYNYRLLYALPSKRESSLQWPLNGENVKNNVLGIIASDGSELYYKPKASACTSMAMMINFPDLLNSNKFSQSPLFSTLKTANCSECTASPLAWDLAQAMVECGADLNSKNGAGQTVTKYLSFSKDKLEVLKAIKKDPAACKARYEVIYKCTK